MCGRVIPFGRTSSPVIVGRVDAADPTESDASRNTGHAPANSMIEKEVEGEPGDRDPRQFGTLWWLQESKVALQFPIGDVAHELPPLAFLEPDVLVGYGAEGGFYHFVLLQFLHSFQ